ncbi:MAG: tol-pal system-associated acyl-CoA thioesterase [Comamonas sp.]|jgi:acyl-CoA thioester hydrolase|uniref:Tol-pal system-associated acyl-CoA thioesterase n=3 Tax=Comamonadaceae TaxID=80864 RepID=A0ABV4AYC5_9BURK|nr:MULTISPECIES: tol-pal system-associated acyl-CoA thioesterase [Comamonas]MCD2164227.1 tol-pal system-associated acyl-CoA thioesterase [Comamonas koreensis]MDR2329434.1 tol-pal system-associated acyl-CoA thioesterase [Comamonas sp.]TDS74060.1 acyl-CoA thioester hydrolase [Comamonas sp. JUb58]
MAFEFPIRIYWEDTDAGGIVFYANYLKFMERGRTEWLRSLGLEQQRLREQVGGMFVVSEATIKYLQPARLDDELIVTAELQDAGRASMQITQRVLLKQKQPTDTPQLLCEGTIRIGWVDAVSMRPARIPQTLIQTISS